MVNFVFLSSYLLLLLQISLITITKKTKYFYNFTEYDNREHFASLLPC